MINNHGPNLPAVQDSTYTGGSDLSLFTGSPNYCKTLCSGLNVSLTIGLAGFVCAGLNQSNLSMLVPKRGHKSKLEQSRRIRQQRDRITLFGSFGHSDISYHH
jgi:hypothetical protein